MINYRCYHCKTPYAPPADRCPNSSCRAYEAERMPAKPQPTPEPKKP